MNVTIRKINAEQTWPLRHRVMWPEKPVGYVKLQDDQNGIHFGLFKHDSLIAVISLFIEGKSVQFRKFATENAEQGSGYGTKLLQHVMREVSNYGAELIWCNARVDKTSFYSRFGMTETEHRFVKDGIGYVMMEKKITSDK